MVNGKLDAELTQEEESELASLYPAPIEFKVGNKLTLYLLPMDLEHCQHCVYHARPVIRALLETGKMDPAKSVGDMLQMLKPEIQIAISEHREATNRAIAIATGKSSRYIGRLPPGVVLALVMALANINIDFFVLAAGSLAFAPETTAAQQTSPAADGDGQTSSII